MEDTLVFVYEAEGDRLATLDVSVAEYSIAVDVESLPLTISLTNSPSDDVTVTFTPQFDADENSNVDSTELNDATTVTITPESLSFVAWDEEMDFTVTVSNWDFTKGESFRLNFGYSGTNAASYVGESDDYIKFLVVSSETTETPTITLDSGSVVAETYGFYIEGTVSTYGTAYFLTLPYGQAAPTSGAELTSWGTTAVRRL